MNNRKAATINTNAPSRTILNEWTYNSIRKNSIYFFRAMRHRNYRLYVAGQGISLIGSWMQQVAVGWLVYRLTNSAFLLGLTGFASQIPHFFISPFVGVLADRWNKHRMFIAVQVLSLIQAAILAALVLSGHIAFRHIILLSLFLGVTNAIDAPVRQSFVVQMVGKMDLENAIILNSALFNGARFVGPAIAGVIIATAGEGVCFLLNALSYIAVLWALACMRLDAVLPPADKTGFISGLQEGFVYAYRSLTIRTLLLLISFTSLLGMPYVILMPVFARDVLAGGPQTLGMLYSATGIGALVGAAYLASRKRIPGLIEVIAAASFLFSIGLIGFSFSPWLLLSLFLMILAGFGMMVQMISCNTILQTIVDDDKRGRIMSLYAVSFMGITPIGNLLMGSVAHSLGASACMLICGVCCIIGAGVFMFYLSPLKKQLIAFVSIKNKGQG
jgi:MFS family permease